ncbi:hypothetical protein [Bradyrhizobium arachidis]|uniref:hypothetical protein n=1 Tax=Bradyrhizobium arachidis TaxID=858423 RepID=UPI0021628902|nr:hypothetical protein [Bradyrhizobium arachidis]UVO29924.1 hypothetical protein KUF59_03935 [Bradyrhizobium arachidis]
MFFKDLFKKQTPNFCWRSASNHCLLRLTEGEQMHVNEYRFTHANVLKLIPGLAAKDLRNWSERALIDFEKSGGNRHYTPLGVIQLAAMHQLTRMGVAVGVAHEMVRDLAQSAITAWHMRRESSHHARVLVWLEDDGSFTLSQRPPEGAWRQTLPSAYIVLEIGLLTIEMRERMECLYTEEDAA